MYYALIESSADDYYMVQLAWGSLEKIANAILDECELIVDGMWGMSLEEIENEYSSYLDEYKLLKNGIEFKEEFLQEFSFDISGMTVSVSFVTNGYEKFYQSYNAFRKHSYSFKDIELVSDLEETEENLRQLDNEFRSLSYGESFVSEYRYLKYNGYFLDI